MVKKPLIKLKWMKIIIWLIALFVIGGGVGAGGYTSVKNFISQVDEFVYFAECYQFI